VNPVVLGVDPGFAKLGLSVVRLLPKSEEVLALRSIHTQKDVGKRKVLAADDNVHRARELARHLIELADNHTICLIAAEAMSFVRNASASHKVGIAWGLIVMFAEQRGIPITSARPQEIKRVLCGSQKASKEEVESALLIRYGNHIENLFEGPEGLREHAFDSLGAVVASLDSEVVRMARAMSKVA